jgi:glycine betaine/proline transport system ATP-binding protein
MASHGDGLIRVESVYKIFGPQPRGRAFELTRSGLSKDEVFRHSGHVVGLNNVEFSVQEGELFVVMGLSGSGKSTALRTVNKLLDITHGHVWVDGIDVQTLEGPDLQVFRREKTGMVFQHFALFPHRTVIENVGYGLKIQKVNKTAREAAALRALSLVGLEPYAQSYPRQLSGGMQQRVGLARALASDPPILLMDEAFSALDPLIRRQMQDELMDIQSKLRKTILFITHDLNEALRIGDRVCILKDGAVVQIGTPEEILTRPATGYVAEFVQDVDQGRVIEVSEVMDEPNTISATMSLRDACIRIGDQPGAFVVDEVGRPVQLLTADDGRRAADMGTTELGPALRTDFEIASGEDRFNTVYAAAGRGLPIAVVDSAGILIGNLNPRRIMEEMGRVEQLIDGYEREVFM